MKSTLVNMVAVLFGITLVASAGVGAVHMVTAEPIAQAERNNAEKLIREVLPDGVEVSPADTLLDVKGNVVYVCTATRDGEVAGYAVATPSLTKDGFNGKVALMVGFKPDGAIYNIRVLKQNETPGLGTNMTAEGNKLYRSFFDKKTGEGRNPGGMKLAVTKEGGDVDGLTAATISSKAYVNAVASAYAAFLKKSGQPEAQIDGASSVTAAAQAEAAETVTAGEQTQKGGENE